MYFIISVSVTFSNKIEGMTWFRRQFFIEFTSFKGNLDAMLEPMLQKLSIKEVAILEELLVICSLTRILDGVKWESLLACSDELIIDHVLLIF